MLIDPQAPNRILLLPPEQQASINSSQTRQVSEHCQATWSFGRDGLLLCVPLILYKGVPLHWQERDQQLVAVDSSNAPIALLEFNAPGGFARTSSGHAALLPNQKHIIVSLINEPGAVAIPIAEGNWCAWASPKHNFDPGRDLLPFTLHVDHPGLHAPKHSILYVSQIFGHITAAFRLLDSLPSDDRKEFFVAAKNTDNVPAVIDQMRTSAGLSTALVPMTYDDAISGGNNITNPGRALWFLDQNPELLDRALRSRVILSDLREEVAWLGALIDAHQLACVTIGLSYQWPQWDVERDSLSLHPEVLAVLQRMPDETDKLRAMQQVGLEPTQAVPDWHAHAAKWKAGVRSGTALATDALVSFSAVSASERPTRIENCVIFPARRAHVANAPRNPNKVAVVLGSGDWTCREQFCAALVETARALPNLSIDVIGVVDSRSLTFSQSNINFRGALSPRETDVLVNTAGIVIIKPGHFSFEALAGRALLIGPADDLEQALLQAKAVGSARPVAIAVEVDRERLLIAQEAFEGSAWGRKLCPLISVPSAAAVIEKIEAALTVLDDQPLGPPTANLCGNEALSRCCTELKASTAHTRSSLLVELRRITKSIEDESWQPNR
ncbi:MAG: hypothetical protein K1X79_10635 [Oligoflexia bacterium]|nr:hypothetical protein [Oligoflexia bacterium]